ncbi:uncharacterized protein LOC106672400 isoform X2 [Cimex lectularius]|uniref:Uncharacterized protein n=1 Tax=Cimex lectularius TaxID=79782 RepID=A0A8I6SKM0_CIMLE|nr:uncharacterized protein LOC106672400 isoform X2 [Cimex lectularius]
MFFLFHGRFGKKFSVSEIASELLTVPFSCRIAVEMTKRMRSCEMLLSGSDSSCKTPEIWANDEDDDDDISYTKISSKQDPSNCTYTELVATDNHLTWIPEPNQYLALFPNEEPISISRQDGTTVKRLKGVFLLNINGSKVVYRNRELYHSPIIRTSYISTSMYGPCQSTVYWS